MTTAAESAYATVTQAPELHGPPRYYTVDWGAAGASVETLAQLDPDLVITGHGRAMRGPALREALHALAREFDRVAVPDQGRYLDRPAKAEDGTAYRPVERPRAPGAISDSHKPGESHRFIKLNPVGVVTAAAVVGVGLAIGALMRLPRSSRGK